MTTQMQSVSRRAPKPRQVRLGPADHGRRMSLAEFEHAQVQEGYLYELGRGVIIVSDVPNPEHMAKVFALRDQLVLYKHANPDEIWGIAGGGECKILVDILESENHPDTAVYKTPPPVNDATVWSIWVPELVIEIVSPRSGRRDYEEKPEEYFAFGISEYWIIDPPKGLMVVHRRLRGRWELLTIQPPKKHETLLLPGFKLDLQKVLTAGPAPTKRKRPTR